MAVLEKQMLAADALLTQQLEHCHAENAQILIKVGVLRRRLLRRSKHTVSIFRDGRSSPRTCQSIFQARP